MPKWIFQKTSGDQQGDILLPFLDFCLSIWLWWQECFPEYWLLLPKTTKLQKKLLYRVPAQCLKRRNMYFRKINIHNSVSLFVEFYRRWVLKCKLFGQESTCHQGKIFKKFLRVMTVRQKVPKSYFQSQFWMSKINRIFSKKKFI